jgi:hypothetical protein
MTPQLPTDTPPGGASITNRDLRDPRVSSVINWLWGTMGTALIAVGIWIATSINELNITSARLIVQLEVVNRQLSAKDARDDAQDKRIEALTGDMREMQGKVFRGVDGYGGRNGR